MMRNILVTLIMMYTASIYGQVSNDECIYANSLGSIDSYCSGKKEFSNTGATKSSQEIGSNCIYGKRMHDVWFSFIPKAPAAYVSVEGLEKPSLAFYDGTCDKLKLLGCNSSSNENFTEISVADLVIGKEYYLRIDSRSDAVGDFQICIKSFSPVKKPESDCPDAIVLCDKSPFQVENLNSVGKLTNELTGSCVVKDDKQDQTKEQASVWYVWTCKDAGTLEFTLTPNNPNSKSEDLDFVVYELPGGLKDCDNRQSVRCMLSGEPNKDATNSPCLGPTGLRAGETDTEEFSNCEGNSNNFVAPLNMEAGKSYGLIVNNFSPSGYGFSIEFGGTGTFEGPEAEFSIDAAEAFECDKTIKFTNTSSSKADSIISYQWNFGEGSTPVASDQKGPNDVLYDSFGNKLAGLTVETKRGCKVTTIKEFFIKPCCKDLPSLDVSGIPKHLSCFNSVNGIITAEAKKGQPPYKYSINGGELRRNPRFTNLISNSYVIKAVDKKGCEGTTIVPVNAPDSIKVDAGPDKTVDLGYSTTVNATYMPPKEGDSLYWSPTDSFVNMCNGCLNPEIVPPGTTTYILSVVDKNGCMASDSVTIRVNDVRPVYFPNIFSPNTDGNNDFFSLNGGRAIKRITSLKVYDRWGNMVYSGSPELGTKSGWDGTFDGKPVENGVYVWIADVLFIDGKSISYKGDITVVRW